MGQIQITGNSNQSTSIKEKLGYAKKTWLLYTLIVLMISIIVLKHLFGGGMQNMHGIEMELLVFCCPIFETSSITTLW